MIPDRPDNADTCPAGRPCTGGQRRGHLTSAIVELTPALTRAYAVKTAKTLTRDLNWLLDRDLVLRSAQGYRARVERMHGFQPATAVP